VLTPLEVGRGARSRGLRTRYDSPPGEHRGDHSDVPDLQRIHAERVVAQDGQVGFLSRFDAPDLVFQLDGLGGVDRYRS
jgi:hypothetical protein